MSFDLAQMVQFAQTAKKELGFLDPQDLIILDPDCPCAEWPEPLLDLRAQIQNFTPVIAFPRDNIHLRKIVEICKLRQWKIVVQGGNTGRCGGGLPAASVPYQILVNMSHFQDISDYDPMAGTITVGAGCSIDQLNDELDKKGDGWFFPIQMGSTSKAQIGGVLSTNAGGMGAIRYGMARQYCLGIEAALPNGDILSCLSATLKNNIGYHLPHLFCGSEGTLGIITKARLKLVQKPNTENLQTIAIFGNDADLGRILHDQNRWQKQYGVVTNHLECIALDTIDYLIKHDHDCILSSPLYRDLKDILQKKQDYRWMVLWEYESIIAARTPSQHRNASQSRLQLQSLSQSCQSMMVGGFDLMQDLHEHYTQSTIFIPQNTAKTKALWELRAGIVWAQKDLGYNIKHDIATPPHSVAVFYRKIKQALQQSWPNSFPYCFGHLGDGNLHLNIILPYDEEDPKNEGNASNTAESITAMIDDMLADHGGSISAEHGIGQSHVKRLKKHVSQPHYRLLKSIKTAIDPDHIMNPGKLL
jgi:FAD/FMN-containing dehydrogenase